MNDIKNKKYYISNLESGDSDEVSKKKHETYMKMWECTKPKIIKDGKVVGRVIIFGTGGESYD